MTEQIESRAYVPAPAPVTYTLELLRQECRVVRDMEDRLLNASSLIAEQRPMIDKILALPSSGTAEEHEDAQGLRQPGFYLIEVAKWAQKPSEDDKAHLRARLGEARRSVREIFGGMNRLGLAAHAEDACLSSIAMCEGRYLAAVWLRWSEYIKFRRQGKGRERIYSVSEDLIWHIAKFMLSKPLVDADEDVQDQYTKYWTLVQGSAKPLSEYYSSVEIRTAWAASMEPKLPQSEVNDDIGAEEDSKQQTDSDGPADKTAN
ncbi:MAG: hypothetical protein NCW75_14335 [Phycisphaera sp.]|nr:MAG: hypothetical protein NCW75_14335 [Phycisphaera sp.]